MIVYNGNIGWMGLGDKSGWDVDTKEVTLKLRREELMYDIKNMAFVEGDKMPEEEPHAKHLTHDIGEKGNIDRVSRILALIHAAAVELLYPMTKVDVTAQEISDERIEPETYDIELAVPLTMSQTTLVLLAQLVHEWMVCRVLGDWLSITNPSAAENWMAKAARTEEEIDKIKNNRRGGTSTRPMQPF